MNLLVPNQTFYVWTMNLFIQIWFPPKLVKITYEAYSATSHDNRLITNLEIIIDYQD